MVPRLDASKSSATKLLTVFHSVQKGQDIALLDVALEPAGNPLKANMPANFRLAILLRDSMLDHVI